MDRMSEQHRSQRAPPQPHQQQMYQFHLHPHQQQPPQPQHHHQHHQQHHHHHHHHRQQLQHQHPHQQHRQPHSYRQKGLMPRVALTPLNANLKAMHVYTPQRINQPTWQQPSPAVSGSATASRNFDTILGDGHSTPHEKVYRGGGPTSKRPTSVRGNHGGVVSVLQPNRRRRRGPKKPVGESAPFEVPAVVPSEPVHVRRTPFDYQHRGAGIQAPLVSLYVQVDASEPAALSMGMVPGAVSPPEDKTLAAQLGQIYERNGSVLHDHATHLQAVNQIKAERATELWLKQKSDNERQAYLLARSSAAEDASVSA